MPRESQSAYVITYCVGGRLPAEAETVLRDQVVLVLTGMTQTRIDE